MVWILKVSLQINSMPQRLVTFVCPDSTRRTFEKLALHVEVLEFPRGKGKTPPKFHFILPKFYFSSTWRIKDSHVGM